MSLAAGFLDSSERFPNRPALRVGDEILSYAELRAAAQAVAATLSRHPEPGSAALTAVFAGRSRELFSGVLGALLAGHGYVPLNPSFPRSRTRDMLQRSGCRTVVVDDEGAGQLREVLGGVPPGLLLILPGSKDVRELAASLPDHRVIGARELAAAESWSAPAVDADDVAYLLFTSGSTGIPKSVPVTHGNVRHFLDRIRDRYALDENDRFSQMFDLSFDLSVFDLFAAWDRGASVWCPSRSELLTPGGYLRDCGITVWFSVPSLGVLMNRLGLLQPAMYPELRLSLFCGEALPASLAQQWNAAAPNSVLENLYGPTELTIACTAYRWNERTSPLECENGLVPIGAPFAGMDALVVDEQLREVQAGREGELVMNGPQRTAGYLHDLERTAAAYVELPGRSGVYYRTGDLVRRPRTSDNPLVYLSRKDHQVKVHGMRVELGEIEAALRELAGVDIAVAMGWPVRDGSADGIVAFVGPGEVEVDAVRQGLLSRLPRYMVPRTVHHLSEFPLNANGKVDRKELIKRLEGRARAN